MSPVQAAAVHALLSLRVAYGLLLEHCSAAAITLRLPRCRCWHVRRCVATAPPPMFWITKASHAAPGKPRSVSAAAFMPYVALLFCFLLFSGTILSASRLAALLSRQAPARSRGRGMGRKPHMWLACCRNSTRKTRAVAFRGRLAALTYPGCWAGQDAIRPGGPLLKRSEVF